MLRDYDGKVVNEGDFMIEAEEDSAFFYVIYKGKPEYFANWTCETPLKLVDIEKLTENIDNMSEEDENRRFYKNYIKSVYERKFNMKTEDMYVIDGKLKQLLCELVISGKPIEIKETHICNIGIEEGA